MEIEMAKPKKGEGEIRKVRISDMLFDSFLLIFLTT